MPKIFYINLDRVPQRAAFIERQLDSVGLAGSAERYSAVDAAKSADMANSSYLPGGWRPRWSMCQTEVACFESHRRLWHHIVEQDIDSAIVVEDDVFLSTSFAEAITALEQAPAEIDVVKLDGAIMPARYGDYTEIGSFHLRPILHPVQSSAGYRLTLKGAARLIELSERYSQTVDDFIFQPKKNWNAVQLFPAVAVQGMFRENSNLEELHNAVASSERTADPSINVRLDKGPAVYRISKELRRFARKAKRKLWKDRMLLKKGGFIGQPTLAEDLGTYSLRSG